jgi:hypothetical protein
LKHRKFKDFNKETYNIKFRKCIDCLEWIELNDINFGKDKHNKLGFNIRCKICQKKSNRNYYQENREHLIEIASIRQENNKEQVEKAKAKWFKQNDERLNKKHKEYQNSRRDWWLNYQREYKKTEKGKEIFKRHSENRRKYKKHIIKPKEWLKCKEYFGNCCAYCGITDKEHKKLYKEQLHKEHVICDGRNDIKNCVPCCRNCNRSKDQKSLNNWYNTNNINYTYERYYKIYLWLKYDYKKIILPKKKNKK